MLHSFSDVVCIFPLFPLKGRVFCILVASYGHVSIGSVVKLLVALLWSGRGITRESLLIDSHRHRSIHTRVVHLGADGHNWRLDGCTDTDV